MKITIEATERTISIDLRADHLCLEQLIQEGLMPAVLALGYSPKLVEEYLDPDAQWNERERMEQAQINDQKTIDALLERLDAMGQTGGEG